jgi:8-amino-7-oxononanoate synthase
LSKETPLAASARESLFSRVDSMRHASKPRPVERPAPNLGDARATDFSTLPGYAELRLQRSIGDKLHLQNPYFRLHEGLASSHTVIGGRRVLNYSCYDYLGLNGHPEIIEAAKAAIDQHGISCSASRHVAGERPVHRRLERALADHYGAEEALIFVSGYATNVGVIGQLVSQKDLIVSDAAVHNSAVMGSVLSGAARRSFRHNDLDNLEEVLAANRGKYDRVLIVVEGLYSMDGDFPELPRLIDIKNRYHAWLMVDEAHSLGVLGKRGYGLAEHFGVDPNGVDIWMGTMSKTLAGCGGYIAGSAVMVDYLRLLAGAFVYSVGMPPVIAASVEKALELMHREPERVTSLQNISQYFFETAKAHNLDTGNGSGTAVCPIVVGDSIPAVILSQQLLERGINVQPVLYPAVPAKSSRLRFFLTAMHTKDDVDQTIATVVEELSKIPEGMRTSNLANFLT